MQTGPSTKASGEVFWLWPTSDTSSLLLSSGWEYFVFQEDPTTEPKHILSTISTQAESIISIQAESIISIQAEPTISIRAESTISIRAGEETQWHSPMGAKERFYTCELCVCSSEEMFLSKVKRQYTNGNYFNQKNLQHRNCLHLT